MTSLGILLLPGAGVAAVFFVLGRLVERSIASHQDAYDTGWIDALNALGWLNNERRPQ